MKNKLFLCIVLISLFSIPCFGEVKKLSYEEAVVLMFSQNGDIQAQQSVIEQKNFLINSAFGSHLPQITLNGTYTVMDDKIALDMKLPFPPLPSPFSLPSELNYKIQDKNFFKADVSLLWPVFTGGKVTALNNAAQSDYNSAVSDFDIVKNNLSHELTSKYFGFQLASTAAALRQDDFERLEKHYDNALSQEKAGTIPRVERMHAEVSMNEAKRSYNQSVSDMDIAKAALKNLISIDGDMELVTPLFVLNPYYIESLEYFKEAAVANSPQAAKLLSVKEMAYAGLQADRATYMPDIFLFGSYELYRAQLTVLDPEWAVGAGFKWTVFEGMGGHYKYLASGKTIESVDYKISQVRKDLATGADVYYKQMLKAYDKYETAKETLSFTEEYLRVRIKSFESGFGTSVDVVDAQTAVSKNRLDIMSAAYEFDVALSQLLALCGWQHSFNTYSKNENAEIIQ